MLDSATNGFLILGLMGQHISSCVSLQREGWLVGWAENAYFFIKFEMSQTLGEFR